MKLKIIFFLTIASSFVGCNILGDDIVAPNSLPVKISESNVTLDAMYSTKYYRAAGVDLSESLGYYSIGDSSQTYLGNILYDFIDMEDITITGLDSTSINFNFDNRDFNCYDVLIRDTMFTMNVIGPNSRQVNFIYKDIRGSIPNFIDSFYVNQVIQPDPRLWPLIFAAACLVAAAVDSYCDQQIVAQVNGCTQQSKCSKVNSCGAECIECPPK